MIKDKLLSQFYQKNNDKLKVIEKDLKEGKTTPSKAIQLLLK
jgi:hypothetical protein